MFLQVTPFLHSNVRGICGDFSGEKWDDCKDPMCSTVYNDPQRFLERHTTILTGESTLSKLETSPDMISFMDAKKCPNRRFYPLRY